MKFKLLRNVIEPNSKVDLIVDGHNVYHGTLEKLLSDDPKEDTLLVRYKNQWFGIDALDSMEVVEIASGWSRYEMKIELRGELK